MTDAAPARRVTLWDAPCVPPADTAGVLTWNGHTNEGGVRSLLDHAEAHGAELRQRYLEWVHGLGAREVRGRPLVEHLSLGDGFSFWWMTRLAEKSPWKSPGIVDAIRALAFERIVRAERPAAVDLVSRDRRLHEVISGLCAQLGLQYTWTRPARARPPLPPARRLAGALPHTARGAAALVRLLWTRIVLAGARRPRWFEGRRAVALCSYFDNIDLDAADAGRFQSHYWGPLPDLLRRLGYRDNWTHAYVASAAMSPLRAVRIVRRFTAARESQGSHALIEACFPLTAIPRVVARWCWLQFQSWRLHEIARHFTPRGSALSLWPFLRDDWLSSLRGTAAVAGLAWIEMFDALLRDMPRQPQGLYLQENQAWERAWIHAWRKHGHGTLRGVAHSTIRFWDLRYFNSPQPAHHLSHPRPDPAAMVVTGPAAFQTLVDAGESENGLRLAEALRYGHLATGNRQPGSPPYQMKGPRILVLGDMLASATRDLWRWMVEAAVHLPDGTTFTFRSHPNLEVDRTWFGDVPVSRADGSLAENLAHADVVCAGTTTSAAVDAWLAGVPTVVILDEATLNFSPLRGRAGAFFAGSSAELAGVLRAACGHAASRPDARAFFCLDSSLPRWTRLLAT